MRYGLYEKDTKILYDTYINTHNTHIMLNYLTSSQKLITMKILSAFGNEGMKIHGK